MNQIRKDRAEKIAATEETAHALSREVTDSLEQAGELMLNGNNRGAAAKIIDAIATTNRLQAKLLDLLGREMYNVQ